MPKPMFSNRFNFETLEELAERWKVHKSWLYRQTMRKDENAIPRHKLGKYLRFVPEEADRWLADQQR
jgi:hypothetical protein